MPIFAPQKAKEVKAELVRLRQYKGDKAIFYSVSIDGSEDTVFEQFVEENYDMFLKELRNIDMRIRAMSEETGAREQYFKLHEGKPGDGVAALYDLPEKNLRLYCLRFGSTTVILGGGGRKTTRTYQEDKELDRNVKLMSRLSRMITEALKDKELRLNEDGTFDGEMTMED